MTPEHAPSPEPAQGMSRLNPAALGVADAARVLTRIGGVGGKPVTEEMLRADIDAGAPTNANGTIIREPKITDLQSLHQAIRAELSGPALTVFDILHPHRTRPLRRADVAVKAGYPPGGSSMRGALAELSNLEVVDYPNKESVSLSAIVFPEGLK